MATDTTGRPRRARIKFVGTALFVLLVLIAAVAGAVSGFLLVYSTDLPQVTELEHYRPSTITQLYDDQNRVIGQFALQRRVIDSYNDFPKVLRDALISTEDKEFEQHWGVDVWRVFGAAWRDLDARPAGPGRVYAHHAAGAQPFSLARPQLPPQDAGSDAVHPDRAAFHQAADLHALRQPDLSRPRRLRIRGGRKLLLQQESQGPDAGRSRRAGRTAEGAELLFAHQQSRALVCAAATW